MYEELVKELRRHHCDAKEDDTQEVCEECAYDVIIADKSAPSGIASVCTCGLMNRAADAIEELQKRVPKRPHGRLIDADALERDINQYIGGEESRSRFHHWVQVQDTVIPGDKEENR